MIKDELNENNKIALFEKKEIRKIWYKNEWYFSVVDVVGVLSDSMNYQSSRKYWNKLSQRLRDENSEVVTKCHRLKLLALDGKKKNQKE